MAAPMAKCVLGRMSSLLKQITQSSGPLIQDVRFASKKAGSTSRNKRKSTPGKRRGAQKVDGQHVEKGMMLYRQLGLKMYPGENVGCGRDMTLFALEAGRVIISSEKLSPYPHSPLYHAVKAGRPFYKKFYNIVPEPQLPHFKLVCRT